MNQYIHTKDLSYHNYKILSGKYTHFDERGFNKLKRSYKYIHYPNMYFTNTPVQPNEILDVPILLLKIMTGELDGN